MDLSAEYQARDGRLIRVRDAAYGDARALHSGKLEVVGEGIYIGAEPAGVRDLSAMIERVRLFTTTSRMAKLVAELDGQVVGSITVSPGPFGEKDRHGCSLVVWVRPAVRGLGVGNSLVHAALAWARDQDFEKAVVEVFASNEPALALFGKFGFVTEGRQKNQFVLPGIGYVDNVLMALEIE